MCLLWPFSSTHAALLQILRLSLWNLRLSLSQKVETKSPQQPLPTPGLEFRSNFVWSRGKFHPLRFTSVMFPLLFVNVRTPAKFCSTPELEQPQPIALLRACLSSSWGRLSSRTVSKAAFPGHHWFHVCSGFKLVLSYRVVVCKLA